MKGVGNQTLSSCLCWPDGVVRKYYYTLYWNVCQSEREESVPFPFIPLYICVIRGVVRLNCFATEVLEAPLVIISTIFRFLSLRPLVDLLSRLAPSGGGANRGC